MASKQTDMLIFFLKSHTFRFFFFFFLHSSRYLLLFGVNESTLCKVATSLEKVRGDLPVREFYNWSGKNYKWSGKKIRKFHFLILSELVSKHLNEMLASWTLSGPQSLGYNTLRPFQIYMYLSSIWLGKNYSN